MGLFKTSLKNELTGVFGLAALGVIVAAPLWMTYGSRNQVSIVVSDKERIVQQSGERVTSRYLVFTEGGEVFSNQDSLPYLKFSSSDLQGLLEEGKTYDCTANWYRFSLLSMYRNLIDCQEQKPPAETLSPER